MYFYVLSEAMIIVGLLVWVFILLWRNDDLANEVLELTFERERRL